MALMALFFGWPLLETLRISMLDYGHDLYQPRFVGGANYWALMQSAAFWQSAQVTLFFTLGVAPAMATLPLALAVLVNHPPRGMGWIRAALYVPVILSMVVVGIAWKWLYASNGLINQGLAAVGLSGVDWLVNPDWALAAVMIVVVWKGLGYYMMMYLAQLQSAPQSLYDAAAIDGAGLWRRHWTVTLPHLRPTMALVVIVSIIGCLKAFTEMYVMTRGGPLGATRPLAYYIYERAFEHLDLGVAAAAGLVLMAVLTLLTLAQIAWEARSS